VKYYRDVATPTAHPNRPPATIQGVRLYGNLSSTFGCSDKAQWLSTAEPLHVGMLVSDSILFMVCISRPLPVGHQVRPEAVEHTTVPRHPVSFKHHLVPGSGRQAPDTSHFDSSSN